MYDVVILVDSFRELIGKLLRIGLINSAGALGFYQSIFDLLNHSAGNVDQLEVLGQIWLVIAASLNEHINKVTLPFSQLMDIHLLSMLLCLTGLYIDALC
jgi:hypothetical protein